MPSLGGGGSLLLLLAIVDREDATESVDTMNTIITQRVLWHIIRNVGRRNDHAENRPRFSCVAIHDDVINIL